MARPTYVLQAGLASSPEAPIESTVWTDLTSRLDVKAGISVTRGRTDEQGDIQPSTLALTLDNRDGALTPGNAASPYYPNVRSGKRIRFGIGWPGNGKQLYPEDPGFEGAFLNFGWAGDLTNMIASVTTPVFTGSRAMLITWPNGNHVASKTLDGLVAGWTYTASIYLRVPTGSPNVTFGVTGFGSTLMSTKDAYTRVFVTFTATSPQHVLTIAVTGATGGTLCYADAAQVELGSAATAWEAEPGTFTWRFTGDVNEWPLKWTGGPAAYAETNLTATDRFKRLGELGEFLGTLEEDVLDDNPIAYYPMQETVEATSAGDVSGNSENALNIVQVGTGGTLVFDDKETGGVDNFYDPDTTTVGFGVPASNVDGKYLRAVLRNPTTPSAAVGAGAAVVVYAREASVPVPAGPVAVLTAGDGSWFGVAKVASGTNITAVYYDALSDTRYEVASGKDLSITNSIQLAAVLDIPAAGQGRITFRYGGSVVGAQVTFTLPNGVPSWTQVSVGGRAKQLFRGNIAHAAFFATALAGVAINGQWYSAYKGTNGSSTWARLQKHCTYTGLGTLNWFNGGSGAFNPLPVGGQQIRGNPIDAMRLVETTEGGSAMFYLRGDGVPVLHLRSARYNLAQSLTVTADRLDPGALTYRGDDYGIVNDVTVSSPQAGGATARVVNAASVDAHGRRRSSDQAIPADDTQVRALAAWKANTGGVQRNRITGVKISLLNDVAIIRRALLLAPGLKLLVTNLPAQAPAASAPLYVEGWTETVSEDEWSMEFVTSPGEVYDVWQIGVAGRSEIGTTTRIAL